MAELNHVSVIGIRRKYQLGLKVKSFKCVIVIVV